MGLKPTNYRLHIVFINQIKVLRIYTQPYIENFAYLQLLIHQQLGHNLLNLTNLVLSITLLHLSIYNNMLYHQKRFSVWSKTLSLFSWTTHFERAKKRASTL